MSKNSKNESTNGATSAETPSDATPDVTTASVSKKPRKAAKKTGSRAVSRKTGVKSTAKKPAASKRIRSAKRTEPSDADIRLRAYFIAERRVQLALRGDPANDWLEARQELFKEAGLSEA